MVESKQIDSQELLETLTEYVLPNMPPYEFKLYLLLIRLSYLETGTDTLRIGYRSLGEAMGLSMRSSSGGNYQQVKEKTQILAEMGFVEIGDQNRLGTSYRVLLPNEVAVIRERMAAATDVTDDGRDYYNDSVLRVEIFERDGWHCRYCGQKLDQGSVSLDHVIPVSKGGPNTKDNLWTCCHTCNSIKSGRTIEKFSA
jgi:hypothetical protein